MKIQFVHKYSDIISLENLLRAWNEFIIGKRYKKDVQIFNRNLFENVLNLHEELVSKTYRHGDYESFYVNDPKRRHIHKANVRDRLLHHAVYRLLYPFFDRTFIYDSYSCRIGKGTHKAINRFRDMVYVVGKNHHRTSWVLKCDIKKFFASINHQILLKFLSEHIQDKDIIWLLSNIVRSFEANNRSGTGLPLGNLTSQLFANIYMNYFDQWIKHKLKAKYYIRYADDFVILSYDKKWLESIIDDIKLFTENNLKLTLHPEKIFIKTAASGIDFLGWIIFNDHRILRTNTKYRMFRNVRKHATNESLQSYLGLIKHSNSYKLKKELLNFFWINKSSL